MLVVAGAMLACSGMADIGDRAGRGGGGGKHGRDVPQGLLKRQADPCAAWDASGLYELEIEFDGKTTRTAVFVPEGPGPRRAAVVLHGGEGNGLKMLHQSHYLDIADAAKIVVAAPDGAGGDKEGKENWNSRGLPTMRDDVGYLDALAARLKSELCVDKVLAVGFSNGGQMANLWTCKGSQPDAMVHAAGRMSADMSTCVSDLRPTRGYVGTKDPVFGGDPSPESAQRGWAQHNGCSDAMPKIETDGDTTCTTFADCEASTVLCVIDGYPHGYPTGKRGKEDCNADATKDGWRWFLESVP